MDRKTIISFIIIFFIIIVNVNAENEFFAQVWDKWHVDNTWNNVDMGFSLYNPWSTAQTNHHKRHLEEDKILFINTTTEVRLNNTWLNATTGLDALCLDWHDDGVYDFCYYNDEDGCGGTGCTVGDCADYTSGVFGVAFGNTTGCDFLDWGDCWVSGIVCPGCVIDSSVTGEYYIDAVTIWNCAFGVDHYNETQRTRFWITDFRHYRCLPSSGDQAFIETAYYNETSARTTSRLDNAIIYCEENSFCDDNKERINTTGIFGEIPYPCSWYELHQCGIGYDLNDDGNYSNDCYSGICLNGYCDNSSPSCFNNNLDISIGETDIDYGGDICGYCEDNSNSALDIVWNIAFKNSDSFDFDECEEKEGSLMWVIIFMIVIVFGGMVVIIGSFISLLGLTGFFIRRKLRKKKKGLNNAKI